MSVGAWSCGVDNSEPVKLKFISIALFLTQERRLAAAQNLDP
jgi:hypothetical protein